MNTLLLRDVRINVLAHHQLRSWHGGCAWPVCWSAGSKLRSVDVLLRYSPIPLGIGILHLHSMLGCDMKVFWVLKKKSLENTKVFLRKWLKWHPERHNLPRICARKLYFFDHLLPISWLFWRIRKSPRWPVTGSKFFLNFGPCDAWHTNWAK